ncbi:hypothetical protein AB0N05_06515 [Nocardia sp. NPDC051030]|uniref:hypothetical protein n=1 Tax=Nocardia sp. NPDC051030 TaxID=3155162 RepID=UPI003420F753
MSTTGLVSELRRPRIAAFAGTCYVLFFIVSQFAPAIVGQQHNGPIITPYSSDEVVARYLAETSHDLIAVGAFCQGIAAIALLIFVPYAAEYARQQVPHGLAPDLIRAAGTVAAGLLLLSSSLQWVLYRPSVADDLHTYRAVLDMVFITGAAPQVATTGLLVGAIATAARSARALPAWLNWFGLLVAAFSLASMLSLLFEPATLFIPLGRYLGMVWFLVLAAMLLLRRTPARTDGTHPTEPVARR